MCTTNYLCLYDVRTHREILISTNISVVTENQRCHYRFHGLAKTKQTTKKCIELSMQFSFGFMLLFSTSTGGGGGGGS